MAGGRKPWIECPRCGGTEKKKNGACRACDLKHKKELHLASSDKLKARNLAFSMTELYHVTPDCTCKGKYCTGCDTVLCYGYFHRHIRSNDGFRSLCKTCRKTVYTSEEEKASKRTRYARNVEHNREYKRTWYRLNNERAKNYARNSRQRNPEYSRNYTLAYNKTEKGRERVRRWRHSTAGILYFRVYDRLCYDHSRRAKIRQAGGIFTNNQWTNLKAQYQSTCLCCGKQEPEIKLTVDHIVPIAKGGSNDISNIQPLCASCNSRKSVKIIDYRPFYK